MKPLADLLAANPLPRPSGSKDDKGTVVVIGGPPMCPGAAVLTGTAALCTGAGRIQLCVDPRNVAGIGVAVPEAAVFGWDLLTPMPPDVKDVLAHADVVVIGVGHRSVAGSTVRAVAAQTDAVLVLDAGALDGAPDLAREHSIVIAPNASEAAGLLAADDGAEEALAVALRDRLGQPLAVRGTIAVVAAEDGLWSFVELPPGLGTPGSGDVFVGALAALLGNGCKPAAALGWAIALHARAGSQLAAQTPVGYLARDLAAQLSRALAEHLR